MHYCQPSHRIWEMCSKLCPRAWGRSATGEGIRGCCHQGWHCPCHAWLLSPRLALSPLCPALCSVTAVISDQAENSRVSQGAGGAGRRLQLPGPFPTMPWLLWCCDSLVTQLGNTPCCQSPARAQGHPWAHRTSPALFCPLGQPQSPGSCRG